MTKRRKKKKSNESKPTLAERADKHILYEDSVQCVESEIDFVDDTFKEIRNRNAKTLREDFCGTANTSCEWIRRRKTNIAYGVDIDSSVQEWGREHHLSKLTTGQLSRCNLITDDVLKVKTPPVDIVLAMNFSYWIFKNRKLMTRYFKRIYECLNEDGVFFLDSFGGSEAFQEMEESTEESSYTYIWDQAKYNPITGDGLFHIHFTFKDGSRLDKAFTYDWRVWTLPELTEMLSDAGFKPSVYWEGTDDDGDGDGVFTRTTMGEADLGFIAYIVAEK